jgi:MFS family permease
VSGVVDVVAPARLGADFRRLLASSWITNVGDGVMLAAGPLLVASQTRDPFLIALATLLQRLPWLLFGLQAGAIADRADRRFIIVAVNVLRAVVLALLAVVIATGAVNVTIVLVATFVLGTAETFVDTTAATLMPMIVNHADLGIANARMVFGRIAINRLAGPPVGALLFAAGISLPFVTQAVCMALGALILHRISISKPARPQVSTPIRSDITEGLRWLWRHPAIRTLTLTVILFNITFGATVAVRVLYAIERLDLGDVGFGVLMAFSAAGGVLGAVGYGWAERRLGPAGIMRGGLTMETVSHLVLALTVTPAVAMGTLFVVGVHESFWGILVNTIRQRAVPDDFQGRVSSAYMVAVFGSLVAGAAVGGVVAEIWDVTAPFWFAFFGSVLILASIWRQLDRLTHADTAVVRGQA